MQSVKTYTKREEKVNYLTHAVGVIISFIASFVLIKKSVLADNGWAIFANSVYGFGMVTCMFSSTAYHYVKNPGTKSVLRHFDHGSIYLLIAASFSPVTLILLRNQGMWGWAIFCLVWLSAVVGISLNFGKLKANNHLKTASYVLMGLLIFIAVKPLVQVAMEKNCVDVLYWLAAGGAFYIIGALFLRNGKKRVYSRHISFICTVWPDLPHCIGYIDSVVI